MSDKKIISSPHIRNSSVNKNVSSLRNNTIRGASLNHLTASHNPQSVNSSNNSTKISPKPLTVHSILPSTL